MYQNCQHNVKALNDPLKDLLFLIEKINVKKKNIHKI